MIFDLAASNTWDWFITLTLDQTKIASRTDWEKIIPTLNIWLDNAVRRKGLRYVIVPEIHPKKGEGVHFHGIINDVLKTVESGHYDKNGHPIFNLPEWKYGFTTAIRTYGDPLHVAKYITKYITKADDKIGGRYFLHGGKMDKPHFEYFNTDYYNSEYENLFEYEADLPGLRFKIDRK